MVFSNRKSKIKKTKKRNGWPTPAASFKQGKATPTWKLWLAHRQSRNEIYGVLLATFSSHSPLIESLCHPSPNRHFDPLGTEFCEAGAGQPFVITKIPRAGDAVPICLVKFVTSPSQC
jgi:hypothetical protein